MLFGTSGDTKHVNHDNECISLKASTSKLYCSLVARGTKNVVDYYSPVSTILFNMVKTSLVLNQEKAPDTPCHRWT